MENSAIDEIGKHVFFIIVLLFVFLSKQRPRAEKKMDNQSSDTQPSTFSESSKTGSSRSDIDGKLEVERDFTKDNVGSPIDLETSIQAERITKILNEVITKTKLVISLHDLIQDFGTLDQELSHQHMDDLLYIFDQYDNPLFSASLMHSPAMDDLKTGDISIKNRLNPELGHLLYILNSYPALKPKAEGIVEKSTAKPRNLEYLLTLEHFRDLMLVQLMTSAADELAAKIKTRKLEAANTRLNDQITEYSKRLKVENKQFEETMAKKAEIIASLERELETLELDANIKLKKKFIDSNRQMVLATRAHVVKNEMLKEEEQEIRDLYENILKRHLMDEKNQRMRRFKVETQLLSWLQKYDLEMGEKQIELDDFTEQYEDECKKCEDLENQIAEQDKQYIPLMEEREAEYQQEMMEKMNKFLVEHAARVIQHAWREILANRAEKKKLKKMLKKIQDAEEAAARAAEKAEKAEKAAMKKKKNTKETTETTE